MKKIKFSYYGNVFETDIPDRITTHQNAKVGNIHVKMPFHTAFNVLSLQTYKKFEEFAKSKNLNLDRNSYSYLCAELRKSYDM